MRLIIEMFQDKTKYIGSYRMIDSVYMCNRCESRFPSDDVEIDTKGFCYCPNCKTVVGSVTDLEKL